MAKRKILSAIKINPYTKLRGQKYSRKKSNITRKGS